MKDKIKNTIEIIIVAVLVIIALLSYPLKVSVKNGETVCSNLFGKVVKCR